MCFWSVTCFILGVIFIDSSVSLSSISSGSKISSNSCRFRCSNLQVFAQSPFISDLWHIDSRAGHLCLEFQFGASQYLQFCFFGLSFSLVPCFPVCVFRFMGSRLITFSRFFIRSSGTVRFLFFLSCLFCCISSTTFGTSMSFSFSSLCRFFVGDWCNKFWKDLFGANFRKFACFF